MKKMLCLTTVALFLGLCFSSAAFAAEAVPMKSPSGLSPSVTSAIAAALPAPGLGVAPEYSSSSNSVMINWTYSESISIDGFKIERKVGDGPYGTPVTVGKLTRYYSEAQLPVNSVLKFRVCAFRTVNGVEQKSPYSQEMTVTTEGGVRKIPRRQ